MSRNYDSDLRRRSESGRRILVKSISGTARRFRSYNYQVISLRRVPLHSDHRARFARVLREFCAGEDGNNGGWPELDRTKSTRARNGKLRGTVMEHLVTASLYDLEDLEHAAR